MRIVVRGIPAPQGSKRPVRLGNGKTGMVESSRAVGPWREAVRAETQRAMTDHVPLEGPLHIDVRFWLTRPKSLPKRTVFPAKRPDLDKLLRSTLDGLTEGGAWRDDSQVVSIAACKLYEDPGAGAGCIVNISAMRG